MSGKSISLKLAALMCAGMMFAGMAWATDALKAHTRFLTRGDSVYDNKTHLTWARCSVGQHWTDGAGCEGKIKSFTFEEARKLKSGGWRVPSGEELATLFNQAPAGGKQDPAANEEAFPDANLGKLVYWTRMPSSVGPDWGVVFSGGNVSQSKRIVTHAVRLVRGKLL